MNIALKGGYLPQKNNHNHPTQGEGCHGRIYSSKPEAPESEGYELQQVAFQWTYSFKDEQAATLFYLIKERCLNY